MQDKLDFIKVNDGKLGAINLNNMIPVKEENIEVINLEEKTLGGVYTISCKKTNILD